jgi:rubrerythrin
MFRRLFILLSAVSLLLSIAAAALWARSYQHHISFEFQQRDGWWELRSSIGELRLNNEPERRRQQEPLRLAERRLLNVRTNLKEMEIRLDSVSGCRRGSGPRPEAVAKAEVEEFKRVLLAMENWDNDYQTAWRAFVDEYHKSKQRPPIPAVSHVIAWPVFAAGTLVLPLGWLVGALLSLRQAWLRRHEFLCVSCGYDLRATPERCPECGAAPSVMVAQR